MTKLYHINEKGEVGRCRAHGGGCPFGDGTRHFGSKEDAQAAYEREMAGVGLTFPKATDSSPLADPELEAQRLWQLAQDEKEREMRNIQSKVNEIAPKFVSRLQRLSQIAPESAESFELNVGSATYLLTPMEVTVGGGDEYRGRTYHRRLLAAVPSNNPKIYGRPLETPPDNSDTVNPEDEMVRVFASQADRLAEQLTATLAEAEKKAAIVAQQELEELREASAALSNADSILSADGSAPTVGVS